MMELKTLLFEKTSIALDTIMDIERSEGPAVGKLQRHTFCTLYELIRDAGLKEEFYRWRVTQNGRR